MHYKLDSLCNFNFQSNSLSVKKQKTLHKSHTLHFDLIVSFQNTAQS